MSLDLYFDATTLIFAATLAVLCINLLGHWRYNDVYDWLSTSFIFGEAALLAASWVRRHTGNSPNLQWVIAGIWTFLLVVTIGMTVGVILRGKDHGERPRKD